MWLHNLHIVGQEDGIWDICIENGRINKIERNDVFQTKPILFENALVFQGLVNLHDHLEFNLFPQLKSGVYKDYTQWGNDIHSRYKTTINKVLDVPVELRIQWGILKNFLNGITTVVDHGRNSYSDNPWVDVFTKYNYLHSIGLEKNWKLKLNNPFSRLPIMTHIGEGTSDIAKHEIDKLINWNLFGKGLIGIHGIAMNQLQAKYFKALIWCPDSNFYLYNATAQIDRLKQSTTILFGTDSTLSASANFWEHLRLARKMEYLNDDELFSALTKNPTRIFDLDEGLKENGQADLVIAEKKKNTDGWEDFYSLQPQDILMIIKDGIINYFDSGLIAQMEKSMLDSFAPIYVFGRKKYILKQAIKILEELNNYDIELPFDVKHGH